MSCVYKYWNLWARMSRLERNQLLVLIQHQKDDEKKDLLSACNGWYSKSGDNMNCTVEINQCGFFGTRILKCAWPMWWRRFFSVSISKSILNYAQLAICLRFIHIHIHIHIHMVAHNRTECGGAQTRSYIFDVSILYKETCVYLNIYRYMCVSMCARGMFFFFFHFSTKWITTIEQIHGKSIIHDYTYAIETERVYLVVW